MRLLSQTMAEKNVQGYESVDNSIFPGLDSGSC